MCSVTLESGAGVSVWPWGMTDTSEELTPKQVGLKMAAANGAKIANYGRKQVRFQGEAVEDSSFSRQALAAQGALRSL